MNIKEAKDEIARSVEIYLDKNEFGEYNIPYMKQRPIFMIGAPGIGKTAIMEQIASELGIALVSYSMTHHTRQSAIGLPLIEERQYDGEAVKVSEYTMSEIIASVYRVMEDVYKRQVLRHIIWTWHGIAIRLTMRSMMPVLRRLRTLRSVWSLQSLASCG